MKNLGPLLIYLFISFSIVGMDLAISGNEELSSLGSVVLIIWLLGGALVIGKRM